MKAAYVRVSSAGQNLDSQKVVLRKFDVDRWFEEKASGLDDDRPVLRECLGFLRKGDTLYVTRADRLARSAQNLLKIASELKKRGVDLVFVEQPELSTDTAQGELMLTVLAGVAKFETRLRAERQAEGIKAAQARGVKFGRKPKLDDKSAKLIRQLRGDGLSVPEIVQRTGIGRTSVYKVFQQD